LFRAGRGVYDGEIHAVLLGLYKGGGQPRGLRIDDDRAVAFSAVLPVAGGGLRVEIKDKSLQADLARCDGEGNGEGGLAGTSLLCDGRDCIDVYFPDLRD
jgi:hypothetical protein